jgi:glycosyltransferase involved in cell wall biosynthesis
MVPKASVLIAVYNTVRELELALNGYCRQSFREFEIVIADDGSGPEMQLFVEAFSRRSPFPIRYLWQPDEGFRKCRVLNQAVRAASADYLIFADADCVPHPDFVRAHLEEHEPRTVLCGRRVNLSVAKTSMLTPQDIAAGTLDHPTWDLIVEGLLGRANHVEEGLVIKSPRLRRWVNHCRPILIGCNYSLERSLLVEVNGFNEEFVDYWGEDLELEHRLRLAGACFKWVRFRAIQYHLHHPQRAKTERSCALLERALHEDRTVCRRGLRQAATVIEAVDLPGPPSV